MRNSKCHKARLLGQLHGQKIFEWPVDIHVGENANLTQDHDRMENFTTRVIAPTAREAADWAARLVAQRACVEIAVWGTRAGCAAKRWWGWERAIWNTMCAERGQAQLLLKFQG